MANPGKALIPYIKKYALQLYIGLGVYGYYSVTSTTDKRYSQVYSKHDLERSTIMQGIEQLKASKI